MKIVIAPDSFKESLPASEVLKLLNKALKRHYLIRNAYFYQLEMVEKEQLDAIKKFSRFGRENSPGNWTFLVMRYKCPIFKKVN